VAESIRELVEEARIPHDGSDVSSVVTVSIGLCTASPGAGGSAPSLVAGSDRALYLAKQAGRNRVLSCRDN
jgi:diguanylate cyclase (GGDEF)-like protein